MDGLKRQSSARHMPHDSCDMNMGNSGFDPMTNAALQDSKGIRLRERTRKLVESVKERTHGRTSQNPVAQRKLA
jgi:hypothetical protein